MGELPLVLVGTPHATLRVGVNVLAADELGEALEDALELAPASRSA
jgi:hypothetical protein